ncbi:MAG: isopeptide-forming domain-containing fimbrial protein [Oscillospiraceae bacterium]|nr:isopeptide-forming domain-containing fimbrial protein [Oscillospiraceae bacterium]
MKKLKRITALILSVLMLMSMSVAVSADDTYTIVISNKDAGYTYTAYQIFSGEMGVNADNEPILKKVEWSTNIAESDALYAQLATIVDDSTGEYPFTQDGTATGDPWYSAMTVAAALAKYSTSTDDLVAQEFAAVVAKYMSANPTVYTTSTSSTIGDVTYYTFSNLAAGYYLIKTTGLPDNGYNGSDNGAYTRYILVMTGGNAGTSEANAIESKSDLPNIDEALDDEDLDANIGDTITYYLTASLPSDYASYTSSYELVFNDILSKGLTFVEVTGVYVYNSDSVTNVANAEIHDTDEATKVYADDYVVSGLSNESDGGHSFTVTLSNTKALTTDGTTSIATNSESLIQVVFTATLNSDAVIGSEGNPNTVYLQYSNNMYNAGELGTTVIDTVLTWTYELDVTKVDADDTTKTLEGAKFVLYRVNDNGEYEYVIVDADGKVERWTTDEDDASELESDSTGVFSVIGLDVGTYHLKETKAPSGYNVMSTVFDITIEAGHTTIENVSADNYTTKITWLTDDETKLDSLTINGKTVDTTSTEFVNGKVSVDVENNSGAKLPSTGGIGTTIFYIVGGVLVVGAIILLITKKRMGGDDK